MLWIGGSKAGIRVKLKGHGDHWESPMHIVGDESGIPDSWGGDARRGGCTLGAADGTADVICSSGAVTLLPGRPLTYRFDLLITPFQQPNVSRHFATRQYQLGYPASCLESPENNVASIKNKYGCNMVNIHQGTLLNRKYTSSLLLITMYRSSLIDSLCLQPT